MIQFALYDSIVPKCPDKDLTAKQKKALMKNFEKLDEDAHRKIYALMKVHYANTNTEWAPTRSTGSSTVGASTVEIELDSLPNKLKQVVHAFVDMHIAVMQGK
jgi:hypothetical protein